MNYITREGTLHSIMAWHESHTPALSRHTNGKATNSQKCFRRYHFCDPVNSWQSTMQCVVPLGHAHKATFGVKLLSATLPALQVNCGCLCTSMNTQWLLFCLNLWKNLLWAPHSTPPPTPSPSHPPTPIYWIHYIGEAWKKCLKIQQHWLASYNSYAVNLASMHWGIK